MFFTALAKFLQFILDAIAAVLSFLVSLLPKSPFTWLDGSQFADLLAKINYFVPISDFVAILELWLVSVGMYYLYSIWARWVKVIQ